MSESPSIRFIEFNNRKSPKFLEVKNQSYISYGEKNDLPYYYIELYKRSSFHSAIINKKVKYIAGGGWTYDKAGVVNTAQRGLAEKILRQPFANFDLDTSTFKIAKDLEIFGGFIWVVKWAKNKKTFTLEHGDWSNFRTNADKSEFYYTRGWYKVKNGRTVENKKPNEEPDWKVYKAYDAKNRVGDQVFYVNEYFPDQYVYPIPIYQAGCNWIESHIAYGDFQYTNIKKSFSPAKVVNIYGKIPTPDEQETIAENIKKQFSGEEGDRVVVSFQVSKDLGIEVDDVLVSDQANLYKEIASQSKENVFGVHEFPELLLGFTTAGALGQRNEFMTMEESFYNDYAVYKQRLIEKSVNQLLEDIGVGITLRLKRTKTIEWMPTDDVIARVLGDEALRKYVSEKLAIESITKQSFSSQENYQANADIFATYGYDAMAFDIIEERDLTTVDPVQIEEFERTYLTFAKSDSLKSLDRQVIDWLTKNPYADATELAKLTGGSSYEVKKSLERLAERELITPSKETIVGEKTRVYEVSKEAENILKSEPAKSEQYEVMYRYALASGVPDLKDGGKSRPFCSKLMEMNRLYTRDEINEMSVKESRNVWSLRGGWYHNPNTGVNESSCRHTWKQVIVKRK